MQYISQFYLPGAVALWSVVSGVDKGVQRLSKINLVLALLFLSGVGLVWSSIGTM